MSSLSFAYNPQQEIDALENEPRSDDVNNEPSIDDIQHLIQTFNSCPISTERASILRLISRATHFNRIVDFLHESNFFADIFTTFPTRSPDEIMYLFRIYSDYARMPSSVHFFIEIKIMDYIQQYLIQLGQTLYRPKENEIDPTLNFTYAIVNEMPKLASAFLKFLLNFIRPPVKMYHVTCIPFLKVCCESQFAKLAMRSFQVCNSIYSVCHPSDITFEAHGFLSIGFNRLKSVDMSFESITIFLGNACSGGGCHAFCPDDFYITVSHLLSHTDTQVICLTLDLVRSLSTSVPFANLMNVSNFGDDLISLLQDTMHFKVKQAAIVLISDLLDNCLTKNYTIEHLLHLSSLALFVDFLFVGGDEPLCLLDALQSLALEIEGKYRQEILSLFTNTPELMEILEDIPLDTEHFSPNMCEMAEYILKLIHE